MSLRILVADDDPAALRITQLMLKQHGHQPIPAAGGREALALALADPPDAVLLDMMMPDMDGLEVCRRLRAAPHTAGLPILAVTARAGWDNRAQGLQAGIDDYVTKPFEPEDLLRRLEQAVAGGRASDRLVAEMMQGLMATLGCQLVWLLAADRADRVLTSVVAVSAPTEDRARRFLDSLRAARGEARLSYAEEPFSAFMDPEQPRLSWPQSDLGRWPGGEPLAAALNAIDIRAISAVPILRRGQADGLLIYDALRLRAETSHVAGLAASVAAAALTTHRLIDDLRHSENKARDERAFRQMILDTMGEGILVLDAAGNIEFVNQRLLRLTGYAEADLIHKPAAALLGTGRLYAGPLMGTTSLETRVRHKDGAHTPAQIVRTPRAAGAGQVVLIGDLSAEKRVQAELYEQNRRLDALIQATRTMTSTLNLAEVPERILAEAARVLDAEAGAILLVAGDASEPGSLRFAAAVGPETAALQNRIAPPGAGLAGWVAQTGLAALVDDARDDPRFPDGRDGVTGLKVRSLLAVPVRSSDAVIGVLELLNKRSGAFGVNDRLLLESLALSAAVAIQNAQLYARLEASLKALAESQAQLVRAEKLTATGKMAAILAHEINNPLQSVKTALTLAARPELPQADRERCLNLAHSETERVTGLLQRMLEMHRPSKGERGPVSLPAVVEKVLALAEPRLRQNEIEVVRDWPADLPPVTGIADQFTQVFLNLVLNACDAMPAAGRLTIRFRPAPAGDALLAEVSDTGPGVSEAARAQLFEPFYTTKPAGTGLGLAVTRDIVERHGGRIEVENGAARGALFRLTLPL